MNATPESVTREDSPRLDGLPGADLIERGMADLKRGRETPEAILLEVAHSRLRALGVRVSEVGPSHQAAELRLFESIAERYPGRDPYALYSAWLGELDSFLWALTARRRRDALRDSQRTCGAAPSGRFVFVGDPGAK